jgi:hypothetical protein
MKKFVTAVVSLVLVVAIGCEEKKTPARDPSKGVDVKAGDVEVKVGEGEIKVDAPETKVDIGKDAATDEKN